MDPTVKSANAATAFLIMREGSMTEPLDFTTPALDLCVRRKKRSPSPEGASQSNLKGESVYVEAPSSTYCFSSPVSQDGSESSDAPVSPDHIRECSSCPGKVSGVHHQQRAKIPRPFKAYPKDPLSLAVGVATAEAIIGQDAAEAYTEFRKRMLSQVQANNVGTNKNMRRITQHPINSNNNDPTYWEKRRKNNEAAKRSRDARRAKEDEIAIRCAFLEQENLKLRYEVAALRNETERLRNLVYN